MIKRYLTGFNIEPKKLIISILLGLAGFVASFYSLNFNNPPYVVSIEWCDSLPLLAGMAFGGRYGLIAAILGLGAFYPLALYPNNGWACILTITLLALTYFAVGYFTGLRRKNPTFWNLPLITYPLVVLVYNILFRILFPIALSFNPPFWNPAAELSMPTPILDGIVVKSFIILLVLIIFDNYLLKLPFIRKWFGLEIKKESRNNGWIALGTLLSSILLWCVFILFNRIFIDQTFPQELFQVKDPREIIASIVFLTAGFLIGLFIIQFMESRLKAEDELIESEERFRLLAENSTDMISRHDLRGRYLYVSPSCYTLLGYKPEDLIGHLAFDFIHPDDILAVEKSLSNITLQTVVSNTTLRLHRKDGQYIWVETTSQTILDNKTGVIREIHASTRDVTERRQAEEQIRQLNAELEQRVRERTLQLETANQEMEAFSYSVSHDLRAPLRTMSGYSGILLTDYQDKLDLQGLHYLTRIQDSSQRMGQLINDLLDLSRITRTGLARQQVNLSVLAKEIAAELQVHPSNHLQVEWDISDNLVVEGDPPLLKVMLVNLLNNAFKFTSQRQKAVIQFGMTKLDKECVYFVRDNGAGFDMNYADKLFTPFQRLHGAKEFPGTGIGLATVQRIISRHNGRIWAESAVDQGATFYFTLGELAAPTS